MHDAMLILIRRRLTAQGNGQAALDQRERGATVAQKMLLAKLAARCRPGSEAPRQI